MSKTAETSMDLVTMQIGTSLFGIPVSQVRDVLKSPPIYPTPLASAEIAGSINLRGRIVTALDMRVRLGLPARSNKTDYMCVIVEQENAADQEYNALIVDDVGDVLSVSMAQYEMTPTTLSKDWDRVTRGLFRRDDALLLVLDVDAVLDLQLTHERAA